MKPIITILLLFIGSLVFSQITLLQEYPFHDKEEVHYNAIYKWGLLEINAGKVTFRVDSINENGTDYYKFKSTGVSLPKYDWIYKIRDTFQSKVEVVNFQPIYYERRTLEGDYQVYNRSFFNDDLIEMYLENNKTGKSYTSLPLEKDIFDLQTAVYYARLLDLKNAKLGDTFQFNIIIDGKPYHIPITYEGQEIVELSKNKKYSCHKISTSVIEGTIFKKGQIINVWVSDDGRQYPIRVEAPIIVGKVKAEIIE